MNILRNLIIKSFKSRKFTIVKTLKYNEVFEYGYSFLYGYKYKFIFNNEDSFYYFPDYFFSFNNGESFKNIDVLELGKNSYLVVGVHKNASI